MSNKKIIIAIVVLSLFLGLFLFFLFNGNRKKEETTAIPTPTPEIPESLEKTGQGDPNAFQKLEEKTTKGYPLFPKTPHREKNWTLDYVDAMHLVVTVKGTITETIKAEVLTWIRNQGVDPDTHKIDWVGAR